jgi:hypothetical protein
MIHDVAILQQPNIEVFESNIVTSLESTIM